MASKRLIFTTTNKEVAHYFGDTKEYFVNIRNPFVINDGDNSWERLDEDFLIKKLGKDTFNNIVDDEYRGDFTFDTWLKYINEVEALPISIDVVSIYIKNNTIFIWNV